MGLAYTYSRRRPHSFAVKVRVGLASKIRCIMYRYWLDQCGERRRVWIGGRERRSGFVKVRFKIKAGAQSHTDTHIHHTLNKRAASEETTSQERRVARSNC